jgi:tellurium resistance protein TerD
MKQELQMISLSKGQKIDLTKTNPSLQKLLIGLGWQKRATDGAPFDLDASALLLDSEGKALGETSFVFFRNPVSPDGAVKTHGDNLTGTGDGDDEKITIDLSKVDASVHSVQIQVTIHDAVARQQNFGQVNQTYVRFLDEETGEQTHKFDLAEDFSTETCVVLASVYRHDGGWKINAVGQGYAIGLVGVLQAAGLAAE